MAWSEAFLSLPWVWPLGSSMLETLGTLSFFPWALSQFLFHPFPSPYLVLSKSLILSHILFSPIPTSSHAFSSVFHRISASQDGPDQKDSRVKRIWETLTTSWKWAGTSKPLRSPAVRTPRHGVSAASTRACRSIVCVSLALHRASVFQVLPWGVLTFRILSGKWLESTVYSGERFVML